MNAGLTRNIDNSFSARSALVEFVAARFACRAEAQRTRVGAIAYRSQNTAIRRGGKARRRGYSTLAPLQPATASFSWAKQVDRDMLAT
jgi:hypothetical protein